MMINIRPETPGDYDEIFTVVKKAFEQAEHTDGDEQNLVSRLRKSDAYIPGLSLVAEMDGRIVGHIMFTKLPVAGTIQLGLAPLSVLPEYQRRGIGGELVKKGHQAAGELGDEFSILVGHPGYYPRFGYVLASSFGIKCPLDVPEECFMAINLQNKKTLLNGTVEYPAAFFDAG